MTKEEYFQILSNMKVNKNKTKKIEDLYGTDIPEIVKKVISCADKAVFFDDGYRSLSISEICDAEKDLHVNFVEKNIIPLIDCGENDFIIYDLNRKCFAKFNIVDEVVFKKKKTLEELMK